MGHDGGVSAAGVVQQLRRYPIKSMLGEVVPLATLTARGLLGDRVGAVIDDETGRVVSVKYPRRWARVLELRAVTDDAGVHVCFPDGKKLSADDGALADELSTFLGRSVHIAASPPPNAVFDELWTRDLKDGADPYLGLPSRTVEGESYPTGGDVITSFDGKQITTAQQLQDAVDAKQPGDTVTITYVRGGKRHTVNVTLASRPS